MYVQRKIDAESYIPCWGQKATITYLEYMFVALDTQHAMRMRHIVICGLFDCKIFLHYIKITPLKK
jgi:hypothetical protein